MPQRPYNFSAGPADRLVARGAGFRRRAEEPGAFRADPGHRARGPAGTRLKACPGAFDYAVVVEHGSMYNTPPTYAIYIAGLTFQWLKRQREDELSGVAAMELGNRATGELLASSTPRTSTSTRSRQRAARA